MRKGPWETGGGGELIYPSESLQNAREILNAKEKNQKKGARSMARGVLVIGRMEYIGALNKTSPQYVREKG